MRHYLFPEDGEPLRMSQRLIQGLVFGEDAVPPLANTRQRILSLSLRSEDGEPQEVIHTEASIWQFDEDGKADRYLREGGLEYMNLASHKIGLAGGNVVDLHRKRKRQQLDEIHRWKPTSAQIQIAIDDIWLKKGRKRLKELKGTALKRPPLTSEARRALSEIEGTFWRIDNELELLTETALKGFVFEVRERAGREAESGPLYVALGELADRKREILRRKRSGKGTWYAVVEMTQYDADDVGHVQVIAHEKHDGRPDAVVAARRLLAKHVGLFSERATVEARLMTDIEWTLEGRD